MRSKSIKITYHGTGPTCEVPQALGAVPGVPYSGVRLRDPGLVGLALAAAALPDDPEAPGALRFDLVLRPE